MASGVVVAFDEDAGFGTVRSAADGRELFFHCTQIADGSRSVEVGAAVRFSVVAGHLGQWEAAGVEKQ
ncbi:MAG: cold shock protein [Actinomycetota bacterium]|jgi:cold shock CspA family protein|nr:cold shock protein [Actinomycetota bacterium]